MFGLLSGKKFAEVMGSLQSALVLMTAEVDERLQRRQQTALASLVDDQEASLSALRRLTEENPPTAAFCPWRKISSSGGPARARATPAWISWRPSWKPFWPSTA